MNILADESVDFSIIEYLRENGLVVHSIAEQTPSIMDEDVLEIANALKALLITEDKDFGELVFRLHLTHSGVILLRLSGCPQEQRSAIAGAAILVHLTELKGAFSVFDGKKLRIRK